MANAENLDKADWTQAWSPTEAETLDDAIADEGSDE